MTIQEFLLRMLIFVQPSIPAVLAVLLVTMVVAAVLLVRVRGLWADQKRFRWLGIFYELGARDRLCLACSWLRLMFLLVLLVRFKKLDALSFLLFFVPALVCMLTTKKVKKIPSKLLWLAAETVALLSSNLVCGFYHDMQGGIGFVSIYVLMALFTSLLGIYLFLMDLSDISEGRSAGIHE